MIQCPCDSTVGISRVNTKFVEWPVVDSVPVPQQTHNLVRPEAIVFGGGLRFTRNVFFISTRDLRDASADRREILQGDEKTRPHFIMPIQNFGGPTPKNIYGPITCKIWPDFGRLQNSAARIKILKIRQVRFVPRFLSCLVKKS